MVTRNSALTQRNTQEGLTTSAVLALATDLLGEIDLQPGQGFGYCSCPGANLHHNRTNRRDTRVYLTGVPTLYCLHTSCLAEVEEANRNLRSQIGRLESGRAVTPKRYVKTAEQCAREQAQAVAVQLATQARLSLPAILQRYNWPLVDMWSESPENLDDTDTDWRRLLSLFAPDEVVWIGDKYDSGRPEHTQHFRTVAEWLTREGCPTGPHVSPFVYQPGSFSRKAINVVARRFLVVESDSHSKGDQGAILRWLRDAVGLHLRAVIDTMGKSIHGWFDVPSDAVLRELASVLPALGCDPALLRPTQVSRLPSCRRGGKIQSLIYLNGGAR